MSALVAGGSRINKVLVAMETLDLENFETSVAIATLGFSCVEGSILGDILSKL